MKRIHLIILLVAGLVFSVSGQENQQPDTLAFGNLFIYSIPLEVRVEIPDLNVNAAKTDKILIVQYLSPGKYPLRVSDNENGLDYEIEVKPYKRTDLLFDLTNKKVTVLGHDTIVLDNDEIFTVVEEQPEFPGGEEARMKFLMENLHYPESAKAKGLQGRVFASFVVEADGSLTNIRIIKGIGLECDLEVVRIIRLMPKWKPGYQRGQPVRVQFNLPIKFTLSTSE